MKIVIATPILFDRSSPFNHLFRDILEGLLNQGHEVTRIAAVEDLHDQDYRMGIENDSQRCIPVVRKKADHSNVITRYLLDTWTNLKMARQIRKLTNQDVLFEDVSYSSWLSVWAAKKRGLRVVAMLQDVWPDNAVQSGLIWEDSLIYRFFECFQRYVYRHADRLICISDDMKAFVASKGVPQEKISVIHNWGYTDETVDIPWGENAFVEKYSLSRDVFYAVYAGNIGRMQNLELVVEAARLLHEKQDIHFLLIGDGARREVIEERVKTYGLSNVTMLPMQPSELATHIYSAAGVNLIPLVKNGTRSALPSKTGVVLSCGKPAIFTFGDSSGFGRMLERTGAGRSTDPDDPQALASAIVDQADCKRFDPQPVYGVFRECFTRGKSIARYVNVICGEQ